MTTETETYQGYTNYETWIIKLWIDNNQGDQEYWREVTAQTLTDDENNRSAFKRLPEGILADTLKEHFEGDSWIGLNDQYERGGLYADLMSHALARVNWLEIAQELIEEQGE